MRSHSSSKVLPRSQRLLLLAGLALTLGGCVERVADGDTQVFKYQAWVWLSILLGGVAATVAGWFLRRTHYGWVLLIGGPLAFIGGATSMYLDRLTVTPEGFSQHSGIWGMTAVHEAKFSEISGIRLISEQTTGRRGRKQTNYYLMFDKTGGASEKMPMNAVSEEAAPAILTIAKEKNIPISDETGGE